jgi:hypothetical protein
MAYSGRVKKKFDPEGSDYDYETAKKHGIKPDKTGHWQSRVPQTGQILKGRRHKTYHLTVAGEKEAGHEITKGKDGRYYSQPIGKKKMAYSGKIKRTVKELIGGKKTYLTKRQKEDLKLKGLTKKALARRAKAATKPKPKPKPKNKAKKKGAAKLLTSYAKRSGGY